MNQSDTAKLKLYARGQKIRNEQVVATQADNEKKMAPPIEKRIEYYEFPNGTIVKCIHSDGVYRFNTNNGEWEIDHSLTAEFAWDRPYGEPCDHLRRKADILCDLPPFPHESEFIPGHTVLIGAYPQNSLYDYSPIEWIVLDTDGTNALCISKYCLITSGYCDPHLAYGKQEMLWWENSLAREICNHHFFHDAFSETEQARIIPKKLSDVCLGAECSDSVFLLSEQEVRHYFPTISQRNAIPTPYAVQKGARLGWTDDTKAYTSWWILPEEHAYGVLDGSIYPKAVFQTGEIQFHGRNCYHSDFTFRPCIQIKYKNDNI